MVFPKCILVCISTQVFIVCQIIKIRILQKIRTFDTTSAADDGLLFPMIHIYSESMFEVDIYIYFLNGKYA
jgi:hypothetical protein